MQVNKNSLEEGNHPLKKVYTYATGIKKRCRNVDRHQFLIGYYQPNTSQDVMIQDAKAKLSEMKSCARAYATISNTTVEITGHMMIEKFSSSDVFDAEKFELV